MKGAGHPLNLFCVQALFKIIANQHTKKDTAFVPCAKLQFLAIITLDFGFYSNEHRYKIMNKKQGIMNNK